MIMILAPGNAVRGTEVKSKDFGLLWKQFLRCYAECKAALEYLFPTLMILLGLFFLQKYVLHQTVKKRTWLLLEVAVLSFGAMILSPHYPDRAAFSIMIFFIAAGMTMAVGILRKKGMDDTYVLRSRLCVAAGYVLFIRGLKLRT